MAKTEILVTLRLRLSADETAVGNTAEHKFRQTLRAPSVLLRCPPWLGLLDPKAHYVVSGGDPGFKTGATILAPEVFAGLRRERPQAQIYIQAPSPWPATPTNFCDRRPLDARRYHNGQILSNPSSQSKMRGARYIHEGISLSLSWLVPHPHPNPTASPHLHVAQYL